MNLFAFELLHYRMYKNTNDSKLLLYWGTRALRGPTELPDLFRGRVRGIDELLHYKMYKNTGDSKLLRGPDISPIQ